MVTSRNNQRGIVSLIVTMLMLIVITLIVIGFTQVTNRTRKETADRQLSAQAFYAAESGVNSAIKKIESVGGVPLAQSDCDDTTYTRPVLKSSNPDIRVTCLLVNPFPPKIETSASQNSSSVVLIDGSLSNGTNSDPTKLYFTWWPQEGYSASGSCSSYSTSFPAQANAACGFGVLRIDLLQVLPADNNVGVSGAPSTQSEWLMGRTQTLFLKPKTSGYSPVTLNNASADPKRAYVVDSSGCSIPVPAGAVCSEISLSSYASTKLYYARISSIYRDVPKIEIDGSSTSTPYDNMYFAGSQVIIDSTARAQDVLRRVKVTYPLVGEKNSKLPPAAIESAKSVCKRFLAIPAPGNEVYSECTP